MARSALLGVCLLLAAACRSTNSPSGRTDWPAAVAFSDEEGLEARRFQITGAGVSSRWPEDAGWHLFGAKLGNVAGRRFSIEFVDARHPDRSLAVAPLPLAADVLRVVCALHWPPDLRSLGNGGPQLFAYVVDHDGVEQVLHAAVPASLLEGVEGESLPYWGETSSFSSWGKTDRVVLGAWSWNGDESEGVVHHALLRHDGVRPVMSLMGDGDPLSNLMFISIDDWPKPVLAVFVREIPPGR